MMKLPNLSYMVKVGQLRYIQARFEPPDLKNPDRLVSQLLPLRERALALLRGTIRISKLRANPFYYYVLARTRYYDDVFQRAIERGVPCIVNIGCGSDTRAHRFHDALVQGDVATLEMDQAQAIQAKRELASRLWPDDRVEYASIDLNDAQWPEFERYLGARDTRPIQVIMEGVSPYIDEEAFRQFLGFLSRTLAPGSQIAYDFKLQGVDDRFGASARTTRPFRLPLDVAHARRYHAEFGLRLLSFEASSALTHRLVPGVENHGGPPFSKDALIQLETEGHGT